MKNEDLKAFGTIASLPDPVGRKKIPITFIPSEYKLGVMVNEYQRHAYDLYVILPLPEEAPF